MRHTFGHRWRAPVARALPVDFETGRFEACPRGCFSTCDAARAVAVVEHRAPIQAAHPSTLQAFETVSTSTKKVVLAFHLVTRVAARVV